MGMNKVTRRFAAWIACFAILFAALAPSISHAMAASFGETWAEICSVAGPKLVKVAIDETVSADPMSEKITHFEHCPFCATHGGSFALLSGSSISIPQLEPVSTHPFLFFQAPSPLPIWTSAQSRAPPVPA
jgi:hypothetical protein